MFSSLPSDSLEKGNKLHTNILKKQKILLNFHKDESSSSSTFSARIPPPHWSPTVPSSNPNYTCPELPKITVSPLNNYDAKSESPPTEIENHYDGSVKPIEGMQPNLQFQVQNVSEAAQVRSPPPNTGNDNNEADHRVIEESEFPTIAALPLSVQNKEYEHSRKGERLKYSSSKFPYQWEGTETETGTANESAQKEEYAVTRADIINTANLGEEGLDLLTMSNDTEVTSCFQKKKTGIYDLEKLMVKLKETNRDVS